MSQLQRRISDLMIVKWSEMTNSLILTTDTVHGKFVEPIALPNDHRRNPVKRSACSIHIPYIVSFREKLKPGRLTNLLYIVA